MSNVNLKEILEFAGLSATKARLAVLSLCIRASRPLSVAEVASRLGDKVHLATIYRTLEKLSAAKLLTRIDLHEGMFRYEYLHDHHHHIVCESCGKINEIQDEKLEKATLNSAKDTGYLITRHAIELFGVCSGCQTKGVYAK